MSRVLPPPESLTRALQRLIQLGDDPMPLWVVWLVLGLTPGICEELFFRGLVFSGMRRLGAWPAVLVTALLFGLAHASIYRLLPTFILGVLLGVLRWRSGSVVPGIVMHAVNNGLIGDVGAAPRPGRVGRDGHGVGRSAMDAGAGRHRGDGGGDRAAVADDCARRGPRDAGYDAGAGCAGSNSTLMLRHLPWRKRRNDSAQRVKWPSRIASQMSAGCSCRIPCSTVQRPMGTAT